MRINESVMCANFRDPRSRNRELRHKKKIENGDFWLENLSIRLYSKTTWRGQLQLGHNVGAYKWFMHSEFGSA